MPKSSRTVDLKARLAQERGTIRKDWGGRIPVALVYPNTYYATVCLTIFSVALQEYLGRALNIGLDFPLADNLDLHVG